jgi:putative membrane protein
MSTEKRRWIQIALQIRGSILPSVMPRSLFCACFGTVITTLFKAGHPVSLPFLASLIPNIVLGLLLVFRTNTAYDRYWEGRKCWGMLVNTVRNLTRQMWVTIPAVTAAERQEKIRVMRLLVGFSIATKFHLRQESLDAEIQEFVSAAQYGQLQKMNNPPLGVAYWIADYLQRSSDRIDAHQLVAMQRLLDILVDMLGACERILRTPMPMAYAIHLKQLILLYCLSLPFQMVRDVGWWTTPVVFLISFTLFGIEEIGIEIENPFGRDPNDLPLDAICDTMKRNLSDLLALEPDARLSQLHDPSDDAYAEQPWR